jgi:hypothetical protein
MITAKEAMELTDLAFPEILEGLDYIVKEKCKQGMTEVVIRDTFPSESLLVALRALGYEVLLNQHQPLSFILKWSK